MKSLNNCNVAVCFVGESRTFEYCVDSIKHFFSSQCGNTYKFFCHTWNTNSYKTRQGNTIKYDVELIDDVDELKNKLNNAYNFEALVIDNELCNDVPWGSIFYSTMISNFMKQQYEIENNMMFDFVIKARLDVCYKPDTTYESLFNNTHDIREKCLYSNFGHMNSEFLLPNPDDTLYAGTSLTMDLIDSLYNALYSKAFYKLINADTHGNSGYMHVGPGILIHKWMTIKNILPLQIDFDRAVYRKQSVGIDPIKSWDSVVEIGRMIY